MELEDVLNNSNGIHFTGSSQNSPKRDADADIVLLIKQKCIPYISVDQHKCTSAYKRYIQKHNAAA